MTACTSLYDFLRAQSAEITEGEYPVVWHFGNPEEEYRAAQESAVLFDQCQRTKISASGKEASSFLNGLLTNEVARLPVLSGCETFLTTHKARVVAHGFVSRLSIDDEDTFRIDTAPALRSILMTQLDHHLISEIVDLEDITEQYGLVHLFGPKATEILNGLFKQDMPELKNYQMIDGFTTEEIPFQIRRNDWLGSGGFDCFVSADNIVAFWQAIVTLGAKPAGDTTYQCLRIEAGKPEFGKDIDANRFVMEVGRTAEAISYTKGCFLGQEPIVMARDRGQTNRQLMPLKIPGEKIPAPGALVFDEGKEVGMVTSSIFSVKYECVLALAYLKRGYWDAGLTLSVQADDTKLSAHVEPLPLR